jgi:cytochrome c1
MCPTAYSRAEGLRLLIRDPRAVRSWPDQKMSGIDRSTLTDAALDDLIAYLVWIARKS